MQPSYDFSGLLCFSKTNTNLHSHSVPALYLTTRAKARVGGNSCGQKLQSSTHFFRDAHRHLQCFKGLSHATQTQQTCQKHVRAMFMFVHAQNSERFVETQFKHKVFLTVSQKVNNFTCCSTEPKGKQKESYFSSRASHLHAAPRPKLYKRKDYRSTA